MVVFDHETHEAHEIRGWISCASWISWLIVGFEHGTGLEPYGTFSGQEPVVHEFRICARYRFGESNDNVAQLSELMASHLVSHTTSSFVRY